MFLGDFVDRVELPYPVGHAVGSGSKPMYPGSTEVGHDRFIIIVSERHSVDSASNAIPRFYHFHFESCLPQHLGGRKTCHACAYDGDPQPRSTFDIIIRV